MASEETEKSWPAIHEHPPSQYDNLSVKAADMVSISRKNLQRVHDRNKELDEENQRLRRDMDTLKLNWPTSVIWPLEERKTKP